MINTMTTAAAVLICVILGALAIGQVLLIAGLPLGHFAWGGQSRVLPTRLRVGSAISIVLYALFAFVTIERAGITHVIEPDGVVYVAMWVLTGYFTLGIVLNGISRSKPERNVMTPVSLLLAVLCLIVALG